MASTEMASRKFIYETAYEEATDSVNKFHLHQMYSKLHHCFPVLASLDEKTGIPQATEVLDKIIGKVKSSNKSIGNARVGELNWAEKSRFQQLSRSIRQAVANWHTIFDSQLWVEFCDHLDSWAKNTVSLYDLSDLLDSLLEEARYVLALEEQRKKEDSWNLQVAETDRKLTAEFDRKLKQMELKILAGNQRSEQLEGELSRMKVQLKGLQDDKLKMTKELQDVKSENEDMTLQAMTVSAELKELKNESLMHTEAHKKLEDQRRKTDEAMDLACHGAEIVERVQVLETTLMKMSAELLELKSNNQVRSMKTESENLQLQRDLLNLKKDLHEVNVKCARTGVNDRVKMKKNDVNEFKSTMHHAKYQMWQIEDKESSDASSDASWVRIQQRVETSMLHSASSGFSIDTSGPRCFMPDALFKAPDGKLLSGADLCKDSQILSADGQTKLEVASPPEQHAARATVLLQAREAKLQVTPDHRVVLGNGHLVSAADLKVGDEVMVGDHIPTKLTSVEFVPGPVTVLKIAFEPDVPVAVFQPPACIHSHGHKLQEIRRAGKHCRRKGRKAAEDVWSIPDTAPGYYSD